MGIQGLLPLLKSIHKPTHLRHFAGQTLGVDAYGWMHRGTVACAIELAEGKPTRKHIDFVMHRVRMLIHFGVKPYLVFDGDYLPSKAHTEKERAARRKESKRVGLDMLRMGRPSQAQLELQKAVDVTPVMAREVIEELRKLDVEYVVAPYEADSQLAYLEKEGIINGVLSEDSDLLVFGVNCLLTKLDQFGECVMVNRADFTSVRDISLVGWSDKEFRMMAMLSGCDYLPGIDKIGLKTAYRLVRKHKAIEKIVRTVQFDGKMKVPKDYLDAFYRAERTFMHQWVFCPEAQCLTHLNPLPAGLNAELMPYIGHHVEADHAYGVAIGDLHPNTKTRIVLPSRLHHLGQSRRSVSSPMEKHGGKPIDDYFKSRRMPLAELDPNLFKHSPSQQNLLETQGLTSWSAAPTSVIEPVSRIPAPRLSHFSAPRIFNGLVASNAQPRSSASQGSRRSVTDPSPTQRASPKRQRLCSDSGIAAAMKGTSGIETATSRFFVNNGPKPGPPIRRKSSRKTDEFDLWSDDSVKEAAAAVVEVVKPAEATPAPTQSSPRKRKKLQVFADSAEDSTVDTSFQSTATPSAMTAESPASLGTSAISVCSTPSQEHSVFSKSIRLNFNALRYNSSTTRTTPSRPASSLFPSRTPTRLPSALDMGFKVEDSVADVDDSGIVLESPPGLPAANFRSDVAEADEDILDEQEWVVVEKGPGGFSRALSELPVKGSEDMIVPESPEEAKQGLNLSQFAYDG